MFNPNVFSVSTSSSLGIFSYHKLGFHLSCYLPSNLKNATIRNEEFIISKEYTKDL
jgi:hypothetical protein